MKLEDEFEMEDEPSALGRILVGVTALVIVILLVVGVYFVFFRVKAEPLQESVSTESTDILVAESPKPTEIPQPTATPAWKEENSLENENPTGMGLEPEATPEIIVPDEVIEETPNVEEGHIFQEVTEIITAKDATNLRNMPDQGVESKVMLTLYNGQTATRIGISDSGWSKLEYKGEIYYAVSSYLTTDLTPPTPVPVDDGIKTEFKKCDEMVSPKIEVNLRTLPSVTNPEALVVVKLPYGAVVKRTGINTDVGWSRVEYEGQVLYCVSSYVYVVE